MTSEQLSDMARRSAEWEGAARGEMRAAPNDGDVWSTLVRQIIGLRRAADRAMVTLAGRKFGESQARQKVS